MTATGLTIRCRECPQLGAKLPWRCQRDKALNAVSKHHLRQLIYLLVNKHLTLD
jgi:hypothetical protein